MPMKRDDDSHSMSNSPFQVLSMVGNIIKDCPSWMVFISRLWFIFGCLGVPLVSPNLCVINIDRVWKLGSEWKSIKVGVKLSYGWWCLSSLSDRWELELVLSMLLCQWDEMWALVPVQAVGRATVGLREERDCGHTSSPDTARCRQPGSTQCEWTWASVSANHSRPLGSSTNRSGPWLAPDRQLSAQPRAEMDQGLGAGSGTTLRQLTVTRCTLSPARQAPLSPSVASTRVSPAPRASQCASCQSVLIQHSRS